MPDEYKPPDLEFPDDDIFAPSSSPAATAKPQVSPASAPVILPPASSKPAVVFDDSVSDGWEKTQSSGEDELKVDHTFRNIIIGVVIAVAAVVGGGVIYKKGCEDVSKSPRPPQPTASAPSAPKAPAAPVAPVVQPPVEVIKCDFSFIPPSDVKWDCGERATDITVEWDLKKSNKNTAYGVLNAQVDGKDVACDLELKRPVDRTKQQELDSSLDCK